MKLYPYEKKLMWRFQKAYEQGNRCAYCQGPMCEAGGTIDHVIPKSWGGRKGAKYNWITVCEGCNRYKSEHEQRILHSFPDSTIETKCAILCLFLRDRPDKIRAKYGPRAIMFDRIPQVIEMAVLQHKAHGDF